MIKAKPKHRLSIVIPTFNEEENIAALLDCIAERCDMTQAEIIVVDSPNTSDNTMEIAEQKGARTLKSALGSRANQMHAGVEMASNDLIFFLHADTRPPKSFDRLIRLSVQEGNDFGMFSYRFDSDSQLLSINSSTTKRRGIFTGGGDQGMFIKKETYFQFDGFDCSLAIMEDFDLYWRLKKADVPFEIIPEDMLVSARKYEKNSYMRVQLVNLATVLGFKMGVCPNRLRRMYGRQLSS